MRKASFLRGVIAASMLVLAVAIAPSRVCAEASSRVALVIGNAEYKSVPALQTPPSDATLLAARLKSLGFTLVGGGAMTNLNKVQFDRAVQDFGTAINGAEVALFYYAGHGVEADDVNYLVPIGANPQKQSDLSFQMVPAQYVLDEMNDANVPLKIVVLDACRNNPFAGRNVRALSRGLHQMTAATGTLISFATEPGGVAQEGVGNSPFTKTLAEQIMRPGIDLFRTFNEVDVAVAKMTNKQQQPWMSSSGIEGQFYFIQPQRTITTQDDLAAHFARGVAYFNGDSDAAARNEFMQVVALNPRHAKAHAYLARLAAVSHDVAVATSEAQLALSIDPKQAGPHIALGNVAIYQKAWAPAAAEFRRATSLDPTLAVAHLNLGVALTAAGSSAEGAAEYRRAIALEPDYVLAHNALGVLLRDQGDLTGAFTELTTAVNSSPKDWHAHFNLGSVLTKQGKPQEAIAEYRLAIAAAPYNVLPHISLGIVYFDNGNLTQAAAESRAVIALEPSNAYGYNNLAVVYEKLGYLPAAETEFKRAAAADPRWVVPHENLARVYRAMNKPTDAAAEDAIAATLRNPKTP